MKQSLLLSMVSAAALCGCVTSDDPADGGFFNGIAGATSGTYDARVDDRQQQVDAAQAENTELSAQLAALQSQHNALKNELILKRAKLQADGIQLSVSSEKEIQAALQSSPQKLESLSKAIANARKLSDQLSALANAAA